MTNEEEQILSIRVRYEDAIKGITEYKSKLAELKAMQEQLGQELEEGKISVDEYNKSIVAIDEQSKEYKRNTRELSKEIQNNIKKQKEAEGSLRQLRAELSNATKAYDALSKKEREGAKGQEMKKHINEITKALKEAEEGTQRFYRNVGNYENAIKNALGLNNNFANSILSLTRNGNGIQGMFAEAGASAKAFGSTLMGFMTNPAFLALAGIVGAGAAFKWFYDYNKGIEEATRLTREFLNLSGDDLTAMRDSIQATADTYGKDYKETLEGIDALMAQYGLTAQQALQVVNDGFQAGADLNGTMLSKIKELAPAFSDAGISAEQMVGMIQQTRSGIFSEQGLSVIQKAAKSLREMSTTTSKALQGVGINAKQLQTDLANGTTTMWEAIKQVSASLKTVGTNSQEAGEILSAVFGRSGAAAGLQMIEQLDTMNVDLEQLKETTGDYGKALDEQRKTQEELNNVTAALFDMSDKGFSEMMVQMKTIATKWLVDLMKGIVNVVNYFIDLYNDTIMFRGAVQVIVVTFKQLWTVTKTFFNFIIDQVKGAARAFKAFGTIVQGIFEGLSGGTFDKVKQGFDDLQRGWASSLRETWNDLKDGAAEGAENAIKAINDTLKSAKIEHITIPTGTGEGGTASGGAGGAGGGGGNDGNGSGSGSGKGASASDAAKKELEELRKAEDLLMQLVEQNTATMRKAIATRYDRQIEDLRKKLDTEKNLTETARAAINTQILALEQIKDKKLAEFDINARKDEIQRAEELIKTKLATVKQGTDEELTLRLDSIHNQQELEETAVAQSTMSETEKQDMLAAIRQNYAAQEEQAIKDNATKRRELEEQAIKDQYEQQLLQSQVNGDSEIEQLRIKMEERKALLDAAHQEEGESQEDFNNRRLQLEKDYNESKKALDDAEYASQKAKVEASAKLMGSLSSITEAFGEENEAMAKASKVLAIGQIAVSTGVALADGVKQAQSVPFPANIAAIATTVATILANVASAVKSVKSAKFATGGLVTGSGTETSDSISASLSNGESVLTARATRMFAPALSAFNQMGGGVPIMTGASGSQAMGEEFLANAVAKGMANAPRPVVSVEEINNTAGRVETIERLATIG